MAKIAPKQAPALEASRFLPIMLVLFAGSGCSALIYEIVWYQLLQLVIGSTAISLGVLLATFMGGLCVGSLMLPRIAAARTRHPLVVYAAIETGIAICGVLVLFGMPLVDGIYTSAVGHGMPSILFRAVICAVCLMPPTFLMGASLPAIARWIEATPRGVSWLGLLYGGNTAGAVFGCLLAGFYLLRVFDLATATFVAVFINLVVAFASYQLAKRVPEHSTEEKAIATGGPRFWPVYIAIALSGATALGAEVIWTRLMGLLLGATVYTFSIILAVFLVGIGVGSAVGSALARTLKPRTAIGVCQLLLAGGVAWTAYMISQSIPWWPVNPLLNQNPWFTFQVDMVRSLWAILPATLLWGASFPLALAAASRGDEPGKLVGGIYAANTGGAILGALTFSMILVPWIGTANCERVLIAMAALSGLVVLVPHLWSSHARAAWVALLASMVAVVYLIGGVTPVPPLLIAYGRRIMTSQTSSKILYTGEGINSSIAISQWSDGAIQFHVSGKVEASTEPYDMRLQRMLGHLPALVHPDPKSVLIVGFGAGVTAGSFVTHPTISRIVICEMEPLIPPTATQYFAKENYSVMNDPRTQIYYDDARHFVLTTREKFDVITSDPIHPWVKGSATLYSKEYFELVKEHLNPGGVVTQWVPLYESDMDTVKSELATFFDVFPNGSVWANELNGGGYDVFLMGQNEPAKINLDSLEQRLQSPPYTRVAQSLRDVGFNSMYDLLATYAGQDQDLKPWLALNISQEGYIYSEMLKYRQFPANLFTGSEEKMQRLMAALTPTANR
jgi:spermidine synthase